MKKIHLQKVHAVKDDLDVGYSLAVWLSAVVLGAVNVNSDKTVQLFAWDVPYVSIASAVILSWAIFRLIDLHRIKQQQVS